MKSLKPIFHCDAKPFALGTFASPNAKDTNMLVSLALGDTNFPRHPTQNPNASQWDIGCVGVLRSKRKIPNAKFLRWACTFHIVCVNFICVRLPMQTQLFNEIWALEGQIKLYFCDQELILLDPLM